MLPLCHMAHHVGNAGASELVADSYAIHPDQLLPFINIPGLCGGGASICATHCRQIGYDGFRPDRDRPGIAVAFNRGTTHESRPMSDPHEPTGIRMSQLPRAAQPTVEELPQDLEDLIAAVESLSPANRQLLDPLMVRVIESSKRRRRILNLVQDALSQLRLDMKYLMFDLEATRRERDEYRQKLEGLEGTDPQ